MGVTSLSESLSDHSTEGDLLINTARLDTFTFFALQAELNENPLVQRVISVFDVNNDGTVSFIEFLVPSVPRI